MKKNMWLTRSYKVIISRIIKLQDGTTRLRQHLELNYKPKFWILHKRVQSRLNKDISSWTENSALIFVLIFIPASYCCLQKINSLWLWLGLVDFQSMSYPVLRILATHFPQLPLSPNYPSSPKTPKPQNPKTPWDFSIVGVILSNIKSKRDSISISVSGGKYCTLSHC